MATYREILYQHVTLVIAALAILINGVVIYLIRKSKQNKVLALVFILNLAFSDLFAGMLMLILKIMHPYMKTTFKGNNAAKHTY